MQEKPHVMYIFDLLQNAIKTSASPDGHVPRIPTFATLLLAHSLRAIFYPSNFIYPLTSRFLLQRPELDVTDVPMLFGMLYSSEDEWKKQRLWMIKFLSDAMIGAGEEEWQIMRRRHTWDLLASLWNSGEADRSMRGAILEVCPLNFVPVHRLKLIFICGTGSVERHEQSKDDNVFDSEIRIVDVDGDGLTAIGLSAHRQFFTVAGDY